MAKYFISIKRMLSISVIQQHQRYRIQFTQPSNIEIIIDDIIVSPIEYIQTRDIFISVTIITSVVVFGILNHCFTVSFL